MMHSLVNRLCTNLSCFGQLHAALLLLGREVAADTALTGPSSTCCGRNLSTSPLTRSLRTDQPRLRQAVHRVQVAVLADQRRRRR